MSESEPITLAEFFRAFVDKHCIQDGTEVVLDIPPEDLEELGRNFVEVLVGWALALDLKRAKKGWILPQRSSAAAPKDQPIIR